jgi:hypothetical protein
VLNKLLAAIDRLYRLPPSVLILSAAALAWVCYFVVPRSIGLPLVVLAASLPWWEEQLKKYRERRAVTGSRGYSQQG